MKVSIITDVLNAKDTIENALESVLTQTYQDIEYLVIDGKSTDGTMEIINKYRGKITRIVSELDSNHFDAMNKGITLATGDIIAFLHADDVFASKGVVEKVMDVFIETNVDCVWGDLVYVDNKNPEKVVRYWRSCSCKDILFLYGWMPPHPTLFVKRNIYKKYGYFNTHMPISADYELMLRFLHKHKIAGRYIPEILVRMRTGGLSNKSLRNIAQKSIEDYRAWKANDFEGGLLTIAMKNIQKIPQFILKGGLK